MKYTNTLRLFSAVDVFSNVSDAVSGTMDVLPEAIKPIATFGFHILTKCIVPGAKFGEECQEFSQRETEISELRRKRNTLKLELKSRRGLVGAEAEVKKQELNYTVEQIHRLSVQRNKELALAILGLGLSLIAFCMEVVKMSMDDPEKANFYHRLGTLCNVLSLFCFAMKTTMESKFETMQKAESETREKTALQQRFAKLEHAMHNELEDIQPSYSTYY